MTSTHLSTTRNPQTSARRDHVHGPLVTSEDQGSYAAWATAGLLFFCFLFMSLVFAVGPVPA